MKLRVFLTLGIGLAAGLAGGWVVLPRALYSREEQPVQFSHKVHTGEAAGMSCEDCHSLSADGRFSGLPKLESCAGCHAEPMGETKEEKQFVENYVKPGKEIPWLVYSRQPENVYFSHAPHVKLANIKCEQCHGDHGTTDRLRPLERNRLSTYSRDVEGPIVRVANRGRTGMKMTDCSECHHARGVEESCLTCHK